MDFCGEVENRSEHRKGGSPRVELRPLPPPPTAPKATSAKNSETEITLGDPPPSPKKTNRAKKKKKHTHTHTTKSAIFHFSRKLKLPLGTPPPQKKKKRKARKQKNASNFSLFAYLQCTSHCTNRLLWSHLKPWNRVTCIVGFDLCGHHLSGGDGSWLPHPHILNYYLSNSKTFQDGNGTGNFGKINSNDFQDGNWESMEMKGWLRTPRR